MRKTARRPIITGATAVCDEHNYYITPSYADEGWYVEKTTFANDTAAYNGN